MISARNQLDVTLTEVKTGAVNSLIVGRTASGATLKATVTVDSEKALGLAVGGSAVFLIKASNVLIAKNETMKMSATNQLLGTITAIKDGAVNSEVDIDVDGTAVSAIVTKPSVENLALKVGDKVTAIIKATQVIVAVRS